MGRYRSFSNLDRSVREPGKRHRLPDLRRLVSVPIALLAITTLTAFGQGAPPPQLASPGNLPPMREDVNPTFAAAAIKPSAPEAEGRSIGLRGHSFSAENFSVKDLVVFAYDLQVKQIVGGPEWLDKQKFDIAAVPDAEGQPSPEQWKTMVQKLLADRFRLTFHRESRELAVFALKVAKGGPKLTKYESGTPVRGGVNMRVTREGMMLRARNETMAGFSSVLQEAVVDRPVVDQTGVTGNFDFQLTFAPDGAQFGGLRLPTTNDESAAPSLFTAIREQTGLELDAVRAPISVMVIDHLEEPSPN